MTDTAEGQVSSGRPPLYDDPLLMEAKIDQYFDEIEQDGKAPTIAGLCFYLGFSDRGALTEYEKRGATEGSPGPFSRTVKKARLRIEVDRAERLVSSGTPTAGLIFDLTNNHGWKNPQHLKHGGDEDAPPVKSVTEIQLVGVSPGDSATD